MYVEKIGEPGDETKGTPPESKPMDISMNNGVSARMAHNHKHMAICSTGKPSVVNVV